METDSNTSTSTSSSRRSIAECVGDMYLDEHLADIHFSFPKEKSIQPVPAHKMILVAKSPVFKAMFCGDLAEKGSTIKITDITAKTFRQMLKHVYTDKLFINADTVGALLHASQKYQLESLTNDCESYLRQNLSLHNACTILQQAADFALFELASSSHNFLCKHATDIISSEDFLNLSKENLKKILECDGFCTDEILIFNGMMKWVDAKIEEEVWTCDPLEKRNSQNSKKRKAEREVEDRRREILGDILYQIRFLDMSIEDFTEVVIPSKILTEKEQLTFLRIMSSNSTSKHCPDLPDVFLTNSRYDSKVITLRDVVEKLPHRPILAALPKHLRNCLRIHLHSAKPFKINALNILPQKRREQDSPVKLASVFCQIKGTSFGKKYCLDFSEYSNSYISVEKQVKGDTVVIIEVVITENDGLMTNRMETDWEELESEVPEDKEKWIKKEISSSQDVKIACEGVDIVDDIILYPC
ncbi:BTB/POZ domain-containing protein 6-like [Mytilus edulis]|uniref:BTB/POZ domain-containing protein 6-like n=1 Tax=Mytilus edulis TaxID=6550 RepID=UPI0039EFA361